MKLDQYKEKSWDMVKNSTILEEEDLAVIEGLQDELLETFKRSQVFRTRTEMEISVLNDLKHPTADSKYWQAMREQNVMFTELVMLSYEYRKNLVEIQKMDRDIQVEEDELEKELLKIEKEKMEFISKQQERTAKDRIREIKAWHEIKEGLKPHLKCGTNDVNDHQLESYTKRFINQSNVMGTSGSPSERQNLIGQMQVGVKKMREKDEFGEIENTLTNLLKK